MKETYKYPVEMPKSYQTRLIKLKIKRWKAGLTNTTIKQLLTEAISDLLKKEKIR
jgi:hypothetical protein